MRRFESLNVSQPTSMDQAVRPSTLPVASQPPAVVIEPAGGTVLGQVAELWRARELLYFFAWRDVKVRYKQTALGASWAVVQPLATMIVFSLFFGRLAAMPSSGLPYPVFSYVGLLPWLYFAGAISQSSQSLVSNGNLIRKVYVPRLTIPAAAIGAGLVDLAVSLVLLAGLLAYYRIVPGVAALLLPAFIAWTTATAFGFGVWLGALNVKYRDIRQVVPFAVQLWLFATPVIYPATMLPAKYQVLYAINPMAGVVEGFRWAILGTPAPTTLMLASVVTTLVMLFSGLAYFRRVESTFADVV